MIEMMVLGVVGVLLLVCAVMIGGVGKIELLHSYHYTNVPDGDTKAYMRSIGMRSIGGVLFLFSLFCFAAVAVHIFSISAWWVAVLLAGFAVSMILLWFVQKKYNGGIIG